MYLKISPKLSQKLNLSPQLIQSIGLLSLSLTDLEKVVREELQENPVLEEKGEMTENTSSMEPEYLDWTQYTSNRELTDNVQTNLEKFNSTSETLKDHLTWQISLSHFSSEEKAMLLSLIQEINDDGYFQMDIASWAQEQNWDLEQVEKLLGHIQELDPPGVGARNLKECLIIQAKRLEEDTKDLVYLINHHLEKLQNKDYQSIAQDMGLDIEEIQYMVDIITSMNPQPGQLFSSHSIEYIIPDIFIVKKSDGSYKAVINEQGIPQLKIASHYTRFLNKMYDRKKQEDTETQEYLVDKMKRAMAFIRAMNQRRQSIFKLANIIAEEQKEFFEKGDHYLRPLLLREMSEKLDVHLSTVSRLTTNKFIHTPRGVFELKHFFGVSYLNRKGERVSVVALESLIKKVIKEERSPLSDESIAKVIYEKEGIRLSRRQVTRFRENQNIPSTRYR